MRGAAGRGTALVLSTQFCGEPKTALKMSSLFKMRAEKGLMAYLSLSRAAFGPTFTSHHGDRSGQERKFFWGKEGNEQRDAAPWGVGGAEGLRRGERGREAGAGGSGTPDSRPLSAPRGQNAETGAEAARNREAKEQSAGVKSGPSHPQLPGWAAPPAQTTRGLGCYLISSSHVPSSGLGTSQKCYFLFVHSFDGH